MEKILVHSCCAPCSTRVIEVLEKEYEVNIFYFNPNIFPDEEYYKRLTEQKKYCEAKRIKVYEGWYDESQFLKFVCGYEKDKEGGKRCELCFKMRLAATSLKAKELGIKLFTTTLTVSPHKNSAVINRIVKELGGLEFDFKKENGYARSYLLSKEHGMYRQSYCGCRFSKEKN